MLEEIDIDHNLFSAQARDADKSLVVRFYTQPLRDDDATAREGRPIYTDTTMIEIRVRGDRNNIVQRPLRPEDKRRFRDAWRDYEDGKKQEESGTPLKEWPVMSMSMVEEMKYLGFHTVEQLAEANDSVCSRVPGLTTMKQRAAAFLEFSKGTSAPLEKLNAQLEEERSRREAAEKQVADLAARMAALEAQSSAKGATGAAPATPAAAPKVVPAVKKA